MLIFFFKVAMAIMFVISGGQLFAIYFQSHRKLVVGASFAAALAAFYFLGDIVGTARAIFFYGADQPPNQTKLQIAQELGPSAIWNPPSNVNIFEGCRQIGCLVGAMEKFGAPDDAKRLAELLPSFGMDDTYMYGFRDFGRVDVAFLESPIVMSEGGSIAFVNGKPNIMLAENLIGYRNKEIESERLRQKYPFSGTSAEIWSIKDVRQGDRRSDNLQEIVTIWDVRDGCRACSVLGLIEVSFLFAGDGTYFGYEVGRNL